MEYIDILIDDLHMWNGNPRYDSDTNNEFGSIVELFTKSPGSKKMISLLNEILKIGFIRESFIVINNFTDVNITLDGNRRLSLLKMKNYPELATRFGITSKQIDRLSKIQSVKCHVYRSSEEARAHVQSRHLGEQQGAGIVPWTPQNKDKFINASEMEQKIGTRILEHYLFNRHPIISDKIKNHSTLNRIFGTKFIYKNIFCLNNSNDINLNLPEHLTKVEEILSKFYTEFPDGKVENVYTVDKVTSLFSDIECMSKSGSKVQITMDGLINQGSSSEEELVEDNVDKLKKIGSGKNNYSAKSYHFFNWRNSNIKMDDRIFNYYLNQLVSTDIKLYDKSVKSSDLLYKTLPIYYRILLEISIKKYSNYLSDSNNHTLFNALSVEELKSFNTTSSSTSVVNGKKLNNIITSSIKIKDKSKRNKIKIHQKTIRTSGVLIKKSFDSFVNDLNKVVHGENINLSGEDLFKIDQVSLALIKIISLIIN